MTDEETKKETEKKTDSEIKSAAKKAASDLHHLLTLGKEKKTILIGTIHGALEVDLELKEVESPESPQGGV